MSQIIPNGDNFSLLPNTTGFSSGAMIFQMPANLKKYITSPEALLNSSLSIKIPNANKKTKDKCTLFVNGKPYNVRLNSINGDVDLLNYDKERKSFQNLGHVSNRCKVIRSATSAQLPLQIINEKTSTASKSTEINKKRKQSSPEIRAIISNKKRKLVRIERDIGQLKINLRKLVIHELAIMNLSLEELISRSNAKLRLVKGSITSNEILYICKQVARPAMVEASSRASGEVLVKYQLLNSLVNEIELPSWKYYNDKDRETVQKRFNLAKSEVVTNVSGASDIASKNASTSRGTCDTSGVGHSLSEKVQTDQQLPNDDKPSSTEIRLNDLNNNSSSKNRPLKYFWVDNDIRSKLYNFDIQDVIVHRPPIKTRPQYERYSQTFTEHYQVYEAALKAINQNKKVFQKLGEEWESSLNDGSKREAINKRIKRLADERENDIDHLEVLYETLHMELKNVKLAVQNYVKLQESKS